MSDKALRAMLTALLLQSGLILALVLFIASELSRLHWTDAALRDDMTIVVRAVAHGSCNEVRRLHEQQSRRSE